MLRHLVERLPVGLLIIVSYRDPPGGRHPPLLDLLGDVAARDLTERVVLGPLSEEVADLVRDRPPGRWTPPRPPAVAAHRRQPILRGELARPDQGDAARAWPVPASVRDVVRHRLRSLSERVRDVLPVAAVLGAEVDVDLLVRSCTCPEDEVGQALDEAVTVGLLVESGHGWAGASRSPTRC